MALSTTGYKASGASLAAMNGSYIPITGASATYNGATQYFNGTYYLAYIGDTGHFWYIIDTVSTQGGSGSYANSPSTGASVTNIPLSGWTGSSYSPTAPTFAVIPPPLSATGYYTTGTQPGTVAAQGNYIPATGVYTTWNGATQYTNGTDFLTYAGGTAWQLNAGGNGTGGAILYSASSGSVSTMPLTGWTTGAGGTAPAPTFAVIAVASGSISGISSISGFSSITF